jgi:four helix bundle protein
MQDTHAVHAWQSALNVAVKVREIVSKFPRHGYAELKEQMITSAESAAHTIAEGRDATSDREFVRFLDMAARSCGELSSQISMAAAYGIVPKRTAFNLIGSVICTRRMIRSLQSTIRARANIPPPRRS